MANVQITQLPQASALTGTEAVPVVQNGVTVQTTTGAIQATPSLSGYTFLTVGTTAPLASSRYLATGTGLGLTDNGAQSSLQISLNGSSASLESVGYGMLVKSTANTIVNRTINVSGLGLSISNGDGIAGNPTLSITGTLANFASTSGTGLVTINGTTVSQVTITGSANQISVANGNGSGGAPTIGLANNPVVPGSASLTFPIGGTSARPSIPVNGMFRYNSDTGTFEGYANGAWGAVTTGTGVVSISTGTGLTGGPITSSGTISIANTTVTAGSYGSATQVGTFTVNAQGQLTAASNVTVTPAWGSITSTPTTLAGYGITDGVSLTGTQTLTNKTISGSSNTLTNIGNSSLTNSTVTVGTTSIALGGTSLTLGGLTSVAVTQDPTQALQLATKQYVDATTSNINYHAACEYATTADLGAVTYNNGSSGVGATITKTSPFATLAIDGANPSVGQRILVKNETSGQYNGIYTVTSVGSGSVGWVLTRATDYDQSGSGANEVAPGDTTFIIAGTVNASTQWVQTTDFPITIGTTPLTFVQIGGPGAYTAGTGLTLTGTQFSITNTAVTAGSYTNANITVNAQGQITLASSGSAGGVTTFSAGTTGFTPNTATTGAITLGGTLVASNGGTGVSTLSGLAYGNGTSAFTAATAAQVVSVIGTTFVTNATNATNATSATTATNATNVAATAGSGATNYLHFSSSATGNVGVNTNSSLTYNYTNNALTAGINGGVF